MFLCPLMDDDNKQNYQQNFLSFKIFKVNVTEGKGWDKHLKTNIKYLSHILFHPRCPVLNLCLFALRKQLARWIGVTEARVQVRRRQFGKTAVLELALYLGYFHPVGEVVVL